MQNVLNLQRFEADTTAEFDSCVSLASICTSSVY